MNAISQRPAVWILESMGNHLWGFKPNLMAHFVKQRGAWSALIWFARNMPKYERILKNWGPIRTHLVSTFISTINGCPYCTYGHAYAFQLHYLRNTDKLFPMDERAFVDLHNSTEEDALTCMEQVLGLVGLGKEHDYLQRLLALRNNTSQVISKDDEYLSHLLGMFSVLNACGINADVKIDQAHDPINRDHSISERYAALRHG